MGNQRFGLALGFRVTRVQSLGSNEGLLRGIAGFF